MNKKRSLAIMMVLVAYVIPIIAYGVSDDHIQTETIANTYIGTEGAGYIIENIDFDDVDVSYWAKGAITRLGALEVIKGNDNGTYRPTDSISNEEVLTLLVRTIGMEEEAITLAEQLELNNPTDNSLGVIWSRGHLNVAQNIGLITANDFADAINPEQDQLDPEADFIRTEPTTREQVAMWLVDALAEVDPDSIVPIYDPQAILNYDDYNDIGIEYTPYVEAVIQSNIMVGDGKSFNPKDELTRAEMAQIIVNIDDVLYNSMGIEQKAGTILSIKEMEADYQDYTEVTTEFYIRTPDGFADKLVYRKETNLSDIDTTYDAPVYINGSVTNLLGLSEGDYVEYLVEGDDVVYVTAASHNNISAISGDLKPFTNLAGGEITIEADDGTLVTFVMDNNIYDPVNNTVEIDGETTAIGDTKTGYEVTLNLLNGLVTGIESDDILYTSIEYSGIVKEINTTFSYLTIMDWDGDELTFNYYKNKIEVEKQNYYDEYDEIGYIDQIFPDYEYDPRDSDIDDVEAGDIVHIQLDDDGKIEKLSAKTNYIIKYATVKNIVHEGNDSSSMTVEYDDGTQSVFDIDDDVNVFKGNKSVDKNNIIAGDILTLLLNEVVLEPGTISRDVKEIKIDLYGNEVASIYKGEWGTINQSQETLSIYDTYELEKTGWTYSGQTTALDISDNSIECYYDGEIISIYYANEYLNTDDMTVYLITSNYFGDEKVEKIALRDGRDSVLDPSSVLTYNGVDELTIVDYVDPIYLDDGTLVIKNGKLVESTNIAAPDYSRIVLNDEAMAAIINIEEEPNNDALTVARGRILSIDDGQSFEVSSQSILNDMEWIYSSVSRTYEIDYVETEIMDAEGEIAIEDFLDYGEDSMVDEVFTIIAEGTDAILIVENDYAQNGVYGEVYEVESGTSISIKDTLVYTEEDGAWESLDLDNSYATINILENTIILKNNEVINEDDLEDGDVIKVLTTDDLADNLLYNDERDADGIIIFVEQ